MGIAHHPTPNPETTSYFLTRPLRGQSDVGDTEEQLALGAGVAALGL
jgi:hypothetical protein